MTAGNTATLEVNMSNTTYYGGTLEPKIKDTLVEETIWFETTVVTINLTRPPCLVTKELLAPYESTLVKTLSAEDS